jgi:hypothetical protein
LYGAIFIGEHHVQRGFRLLPVGSVMTGPHNFCGGREGKKVGRLLKWGTVWLLKDVLRNARDFSR